MLLSARRVSLTFVATASAAVASTSTPLTVVGLDLALVHNTTSEVHNTLAKRGTFSGVLCGMGIQSQCPSVTAVDTLIDTSNCGIIGNICPTSYANSIGNTYCSAGQCMSGCSDGFAFSPSAGGCVNTLNDPYNCGAVGLVCQVANAQSSCEAGSCSVLTCNSGFTVVNGVCASTGAINTQTDPQNCGQTGNVCTIATGATGVTCSTGVCQSKACSTGYTLADGVCSAANTMTSTDNCGAVGRRCPTKYSNGLGTTQCVGGLCMPSACADGYLFDTSISSCRPVTNDPKNCGAIGNVCVVTGGVAGCTSSACVIVSCTTPFRLVGGICSMSASSRARTKRAKPVKPIKLCPGVETACPIVGSASYLDAKQEGFSGIRAPSVHGLKAAGGYECLDTSFSIESCGGCSSMGEGVNCLETPHSSGVGCSAGTCVVFSCRAGYKPNLDATACVKTVSVARQRRSHAKRSSSKVHHRH
ncbi:hypothetical protein RQP46_005942 [Phenoliferia psychrophenolica]